MFFGAERAEQRASPLPRTAMSFSPWADAWRRFRRVPQGRRRAVCSDIPAASAAWALDAPKARATIKVVRLRCLGMAVCGQFLAVSNRFLAVCGQFGQFAHGRFWPVFAILAAFGLFWPGRGARHRAEREAANGARPSDSGGRRRLSEWRSVGARR